MSIVSSSITIIIPTSSPSIIVWGRCCVGDMYVSLDTVRSNAEGLGVEYDRELLRVIIHGVLHLCGINDKGRESAR